MSEEENATTHVSSEKKERGAKDYSLFAQIFAAVWITGWHIFKFARIIMAGQFSEITTTDIVFSGFSVAACFVPVYFSIIMDKIREIRFGGGQ